MGYYNDLTLRETRTEDDDWSDRADYGNPLARPAPIRCACGQVAQINDDVRAGVAYCARCWLRKHPQG